MDTKINYIQLGRHRLLLGDATNQQHIHNLIFNSHIDLVLTDPPYGINIQKKKGNIGSNTEIKISGHKPRKAKQKNYPLMIGDHNTNNARLHYNIVKSLTDHLIIWGGSYFTDFLPVSGGWIFWDKNRHGVSFSDGELAWRSWGKKITCYRHTWHGFCMAGSYKLNGRTNTNARIHPTQKPVELICNILQDFAKPGDIILDCFGGSGTTLIAAELCNMTCYLMELNPYYYNIIIQRYHSLFNSDQRRFTYEG